MGFFDKFKRKTEQPHKEVQTPPEPACGPQANTMTAILFTRPIMDSKELEQAIADRFGTESILQVDSSHTSVTNIMLRINGRDFMCSCMPFPMPEEEWDLPALLRRNHYITEDEQAALAEQQSFCLIAQIGDGKTLEGKRSVCISLTLLCGALLAVNGAVGVYYSAAGLLLGKKVYLKYVSITEQQSGNPDYFPAMLWILVAPSNTDDGAPVIETAGLGEFGFLELQFYKPTEEWAKSYEKLYIMSTLQITGKEVYKNMDTISFTKDGFSIFKQSGNKLAVIGGI